MRFEEVLPLLRKHPGAFAWRDDPLWKGEAVKISGDDLVQFELSDPEWECLCELRSEDLIADDWDISFPPSLLDYQAQGDDF